MIKNHYKYIVLTIVLFILWQLLEAAAINFFVNNNETYFTVKIFSDVILAVILFSFIFTFFNNYNFGFTDISLTIRVILICALILLLTFNYKSFRILAITTTFFAALTEEFAFRGILLPLIFQKIKESKYSLLFTLIICSTIFGFAHLINVIKYPTYSLGIVMQSLSAFTVGMVFCYILI